MFGVWFLMHNWGTKHMKWDSGMCKIQVKSILFNDQHSGMNDPSLHRCSILFRVFF